ncbi:rna binding protein-like protein [Dermatophagoides farinae]|uniref:Rna binding protein-like protein n=1 Tax=Dermatophagoides farinae TaxID=6954 RepID=A0A9D4NYB5_DERFA|nr:rna binding protein-like protein [Dermatophagoides farinae]
MGPGSTTSVIQVTNVAPVITNEQLRTLFTNVGPIREFVCYPTSDPSQQISRVCYVRFADPMNVCVAQHLTNTVFIDRAIMVKPVHDNRIPDETLALKLANEGHLQNSSNNGVVSQIETVNGVQSITTIDPRLNALGLPQYPPLSPSLDPAKIEEIRRTIVVSNVNKQTTPEQLLEFFNQFGEVKYLRMTTDENDVIKSAMIEYTDQSSVANALQNTGISFQGSQLNLTHTTTSILKPQYKINVDPNRLDEVVQVDHLAEVEKVAEDREHHRAIVHVIVNVHQFHVQDHRFVDQVVVLDHVNDVNVHHIPHHHDVDLHVIVHIHGSEYVVVEENDLKNEIVIVVVQVEIEAWNDVEVMTVNEIEVTEIVNVNVLNEIVKDMNVAEKKKIMAMNVFMVELKENDQKNGAVAENRNEIEYQNDEIGEKMALALCLVVLSNVMNAIIVHGHDLDLVSK